MKPLLFLKIIFLLSVSTLLGQEQKPTVTVRQYCSFLNAVAPCDRHDCYQLPAMSSFLMRSGEPGNYFYQARDCDEEMPMKFVCWSDLLRYECWYHYDDATLMDGRDFKKDASLLADQEAYAVEGSGIFSTKENAVSIDPCLKSNVVTFSYRADFICEAGGSELCRQLVEEIFENAFKVIFGFGVLQGATTRTEKEDTRIMQGGYLFPQEHGCTYHGINYTEHALERMAPRTPEIMKLLAQRALKRAAINGCNIDEKHQKTWQEQMEDLEEWWHENFPQPRAILPSTVETEIRKPGSTNISVVMDENDKVITVYPVAAPKDIEDESRMMGDTKVLLKFLLKEEITDKKTTAFFEELKKELETTAKEVAANTKESSMIKAHGTSLEEWVHQVKETESEETAIKREQAILKALYAARSLYQWARDAEEKGEVVPAAYLKASQAYKEEALSWIRRDNKEALHQRKIAEAYNRIALCFDLSTNGEDKKIADIFFESYLAWQKYAEGLMEDTENEVAIWKEIAEAHYAAAETYEKVAFYQEGGKTTTAEALLKSAEAYQELAVLLKESGVSEEAIASQKAIALNYYHIACFNEEGLEARDKEEEKKKKICFKIIALYRQQIEAWKSRVNSISAMPQWSSKRGLKKAVSQHDRIIKALGKAVEHYRCVLNGEESEDEEIEKRHLSSAHLYEEKVKTVALEEPSQAREDKIWQQERMIHTNERVITLISECANASRRYSEALVRRDSKAPLLKKKLALKRLLFLTYQQAFKAQEKHYSQVAALFLDSASAREDVFRYYNTKQSPFYEQAGTAYYLAAFACQRVAEAEQEKESPNVIEAFLKSAQAYEKRAEAYRMRAECHDSELAVRAYEEEAEEQEKIAEAYADTAWSYKWATEEGK